MEAREKTKRRRSVDGVAERWDAGGGEADGSETEWFSSIPGKISIPFGGRMKWQRETAEVRAMKFTAAANSAQMEQHL